MERCIKRIPRRLADATRRQGSEGSRPLGEGEFRLFANICWPAGEQRRRPRGRLNSMRHSLLIIKLIYMLYREHRYAPRWDQEMPIKCLGRCAMARVATAKHGIPSGHLTLCNGLLLDSDTSHRGSAELPTARVSCRGQKPCFPSEEVIGWKSGSRSGHHSATGVGGAISRMLWRTDKGAQQC